MPYNDFMQIKVNPNDWGIFKMMERIDQITERFGPKIPKVEQGGDFKTELQKNLSGGDAGSAPVTAKTEKPAEGDGDDLFAPGTFPNSNALKPNEIKFDNLISEASEKYGIDSELLKAVIKAESNFNPGAVSPKGAMGLMQLMPGTAESLNVSNPFDPAQNIDGGARYLRAMMDKFGGDIPKTLSAYNAGPRAVETYNGIPPYKETQGYVKRILGMLQQSGGGS
jgi:hypothetical protein